MRKKFIETLIKLAQQGTGCKIQHAGSPCNTCFHAWAEDKLELDPRLSHALWLICLSLRGDYIKEQLVDAIEQL